MTSFCIIVSEQNNIKTSYHLKSGHTEAKNCEYLIFIQLPKEHVCSISKL